MIMSEAMTGRVTKTKTVSVTVTIVTVSVAVTGVVTKD